MSTWELCCYVYSCKIYFDFIYVTIKNEKETLMFMLKKICQDMIQTLALVFLEIAQNSLFRKLKSFRVVHLHTEGAQFREVTYLSLCDIAQEKTWNSDIYEHYLEKNLSISDTRLLSSCHPITVTMDLRQTSAQNILVLHFNSNCDKKVLRGWCLCWSRAFVTVAYIHQSKLCWVKLNSRFQTTCHSISVARYNLRDCQAST